MPIDIGMKKYPICDTDIWIKSCKLNKEEKIFEKYNKLFFADAVKQELENKKKDNANEFGIGIEMLEKHDDKCYELSMHNKFFNSKERKLVRRYFKKEKINYNEETKIFERDKNTGEKVSLIYAFIHNLKIVLSDDKGSEEFRRHIESKYKTIEVVNLLDFLVSLGIDEKSAKKMRADVSRPIEEKAQIAEAAKHLESGKLNDITLLKKYFELKGKM